MAETLASLVPEWKHLHDGGKTWEQIAEQFGTTKGSVRGAVQRYRNQEAAPGPGGAQAVAPAGESVEVLDPHTLPENFWDDLYQNAKDQARLRLSMTKTETVYHVRVPEVQPVMYVWTGDQHLLDGGTDHDAWDEDVRLWTGTAGVYLGCGGDAANWFSPAVLPRAMPANTLPSDFTEPIVRRQFARLHGEARRILFGVVGNHDEFPGATGWHPMDNIYRELGIPNVGPGGNIYVRVGSEEYMVAARHSFNFNSVLNDTNSHRQLWVQSGCPDMVCTAHFHNPTMHHRTFDGRDTVWMRNGSYKQNDHHAKAKNYVHTRPEPPDQPGVILFPDKHKMVPFRNYRDGLALLAALRAQYQGRTA